MIRFLLPLLIVATSLESTFLIFGPHRFTGFAETGYFKRKRDGGSSQSGALFGYGAEYESLKDSGFYLYGKAYWAQGTLTGDSGEDHIKLRYNSEEYYGRIGYSLCFCKWVFAPFIGGGGAKLKNHFIDPSPLQVRMNIQFPYALAGLKIEWQRTDDLQFYTSFQLKKPYEPKCTIKDDPDFFDVHQTVKEKLQADFEVGIRKNWLCMPIAIGGQVAFFYQYNHFGREENFPFNFLETTYNYFGLRAGLSVCF